MASHERFGYEWQVYREMDPNYEIQFADWVHPLEKADFHKKRVLDAGCGMGRNSYWAVRWGSREVVAFDYDRRSVRAAEEVLRPFSNAKVEFASIYEAPWKNEFDLAFSIGVIHHLRDPKTAIQNLTQALKPRGVLLLWVYNYEGNRGIIWTLDPVRKYITSRLPPRVVDILSYAISIPLWIVAKLVRGPTQTLRQLSRFSFRHIHSIVFARLIPEITQYWTKAQAEALLPKDEFSEVHLFRTAGGAGWTVIGVKK